MNHLDVGKVHFPANLAGGGFRLPYRGGKREVDDDGAVGEPFRLRLDKSRRAIFFVFRKSLFDVVFRVEFVDVLDFAPVFKS